MRSEFEFINDIKKQYGLSRVGDDCAVLPKDAVTDMVITADMLVEDVDFRLDWTSPEVLGSKVLAVSLSDIAAMGGKPVWSMLSIGLPVRVWNTDFLDRFYEGWNTVAQHHGVELVGGDISRTPERLIFDSIVGGQTVKGKAILRSGAKPGDSIFVTGELGGAAGGLMLLESGVRFAEANEKRKRLIERQIRPAPRLAVSAYLAENDLATSMIDISDGLSSDLYHLCDASGVGADIIGDRIPTDAGLTSLSISHDRVIGMAISGGEDFELLFTSRAKEISVPGLPAVHRIGEVTANIGVVKVTAKDGLSILPRSGYRHF